MKIDEELKITTKLLRKQARTIKRKECYICRKHSYITETYRTIAIQECAKIFNEYDISNMNITVLSLCPNCHTYMRFLLRNNTAINTNEKIKLMKKIYTGDEWERVMEI